MAKRNNNLRLVHSLKSEPRKPVGEELDEIFGEFCRGLSLLQTVALAVAHTGDAELEESVKIAHEFLDNVHNRMDGALLRMHREGVPHRRKEIARTVRQARVRG